ncbi:MAG: BldC family transcriptional regulator [Acidimicrobiia bacterium]|jgi:excisionase family DNA binding protein
MPPEDPDSTRPQPSDDAKAGEPEELLTPSEVAAMFRVNPKTVTRWHRTGKVSAIRTLGGHRRFRASEIRRLLAEGEHGT